MGQAAQASQHRVSLALAGYGDALATTTTERVMVILLMLVGSTIFAFALAEISYAVQQMEKKEEYYHSVIDAVNVFSEEVRLPIEVRSRCREYVKHKHKTNTLEAVDDTLSHLSKALREEVFGCCCRGYRDGGGCRLRCTLTRGGSRASTSSKAALLVSSCPALCPCCSGAAVMSGFVVTVASMMKIRTYTSTETIYSSGEVVTSMYVVNKGMVAKGGQIFSAGKLLGIEMTHMMLYQPVFYIETAKVSDANEI